MKVTVIDTKSGQEKSMAPRYAKILTRIGRATYMTRDMVSAPSQAVRVAGPETVDVPLGPKYTITVEEGDLVLDDLDAAALHELAKKLDVKVHHASGAEKVRAALVESQSAPKE